MIFQALSEALSFCESNVIRTVFAVEHIDALLISKIREPYFRQVTTYTSE